MGMLIAAASSGSGKSTLTMGLMRALTNRGVDVCAFKAGPDYIDPMFHRRAVRGNAYNLPGWLLDDETLRYVYRKHLRPNAFAIIEGVMGLYDGHSVKSIEGSSAELADTLDADILLVVDGSGVALTIAAVVKGLVTFHEPTRIKGVVFNHVNTEGHYALLRRAVESHVGITCYGYMKPCEDIRLESRHLGLIQAQEMQDSDAIIERMAELISDTVDIEALIRDFSEPGPSAQACPSTQAGVVGRDGMGSAVDARIESKLRALKAAVSRAGGLRLGVAYDRAFSFYYDDTFELLEALGVTLLYFSPIDDAAIPRRAQALYFGGGYPEVFAKALSANTAMRHSVHSAATEGLPIYAECGGLMYLMERIVLKEGDSYEMVGVFPGTARMTDRLQHFGHVTATWGAVSYRGHEFHKSVIDLEGEQKFALEVSKRNKKWACGYTAQRVLATYVHAHPYGGLDFLEKLLQCSF